MLLLQSLAKLWSIKHRKNAILAKLGVVGGAYLATLLDVILRESSPSKSHPKPD